MPPTSATTAGAIKAWLESRGLGVAVFRDVAPANQPLPYITIVEAISVTPEAAFNPYDDPAGHVTELVQVDLWQQWRDTQTRGTVEAYPLADAVMAALSGTRPTTAPTWVGGLVVQGRVRIVEADTNIIHDAFTVEVRRTLTRI